jgi:hypothetical protein
VVSRFIGNVACEWLVENGEDRSMMLTRAFAFVDSRGRWWHAPKFMVFDGASIPRFLWGKVGDPFIGDYRRAAVIHDAAYQRQGSTRAEADTAFYEAMRADGVSRFTAWLIYRAVRLFGGAAWKHNREKRGTDNHERND